jgi:hypothetical protein
MANTRYPWRLIMFLKSWLKRAATQSSINIIVLIVYGMIVLIVYGMYAKDAYNDKLPLMLLELTLCSLLSTLRTIVQSSLLQGNGALVVMSFNFASG